MFARHKTLKLAKLLCIAPLRKRVHGSRSCSKRLGRSYQGKAHLSGERRQKAEGRRQKAEGRRQKALPCS